MSDIVIKTTDLNKIYGKKKAVEDFTIELEEGKVYGLLGRNGAGKTTILKMISGLILPTSGELEVFGSKPFENANILEKICLVLETQLWSTNEKVANVFKICSEVYPNWDMVYAEKLLKKFNLDKGKKIKQLSRGMVSSVFIIVGLASKAELTIFDEPTLGLDAAIREMFYNEIINEAQDEKRTFILSTHLIEEVHRLFEEVIIVDQGKLKTYQPLETLRQSGYYVSGKEQDVMNAVSGLNVIEMQRLGSLAVCTVLGDKSEIAGKPGIEIEPISLQKLFVHMTEHDKGEDNDESKN